MEDIKSVVTIKELYSLDQTMAKPLLEKLTYPWEALPLIKDFVLELGKSLDDPMKMYLGDIYTISVNLAGLPGMSVPVGKDSKGLPVGMQLIGPHFSEEKLLGIAKEFETLRGGLCKVATVV